MMAERDTTARGFAIWRIPNADYPREPERIVTVQQSSLVEPRVWLGYDDSDRMHLTVAAAKEVRDALTAWLQGIGEEQA